MIQRAGNFSNLTSFARTILRPDTQQLRPGAHASYGTRSYASLSCYWLIEIMCRVWYKLSARFREVLQILWSSA